MEQKIEKIYEYYYQKISGDSKYKFRPTPKERKSIHNFAVYLKYYYVTTLGDNFLFDYFGSQFLYWRDKEGKHIKKKGLPEITWTIGKKSLKRWHKRNRTYYKYFIHKYIYSVYKITIHDLYDSYVNDSDVERKRYYNTPKGLINCLERTKLFLDCNKYCMNCIYKEKCKIIKNKMILSK